MMSNNMEDKLREKLDGASITPPDEVFTRIGQSLDKKTVTSNSTARKLYRISIPAIAILATLSAIYYFTSIPVDNNEALSSQQTSQELTQSNQSIPSSSSSQTPFSSNPQHVDGTHKALALNPLAGQDQAVCGKKARLDARHSTSLSVGRWVAESKSVSFFSETSENPEEDPAASIVVSEYGVYKLRWEESYKSSSAFDEVIIQFKEVPQVHLDDNQQVCGYEIEINSGGELGNWSSPDNLNIINPLESTTRVKSVKAGSYELVWTENLDGCRSSDTVTLKFTNEPVAAIHIASEGVCPGNPIKISGQYNPEYKYTWDFGGGSLISEGKENYLVSWKNSGLRNVSLTVTDPQGCEADAKIEFSIPEVLKTDFTSYQEETSAPSMVYFTNRTQTSINGMEQDLDYQWEFGDGSRSTDLHPDHIYRTPGIYTVKLTAIDPKGCKSDISRQTIEIKRENHTEKALYFTPNGDNINDFFTVDDRGLDQFTCIILNQKNGEKIIELNKSNPTWDGRLKTGNPAGEGAYYYILRGVDSTGKMLEYPGIVYLLKE